MRYIYSILIFLLMLCACNKDASEIGSLLNGIEAYIEEHPEEALKVLESVNREELTTRKLKAKHALLYSMALDKNYIDVTSARYEVLVWLSILVKGNKSSVRKTCNTST